MFVIFIFLSGIATTHTKNGKINKWLVPRTAAVTQAQVGGLFSRVPSRFFIGHTWQSQDNVSSRSCGHLALKKIPRENTLRAITHEPRTAAVARFALAGPPAILYPSLVAVSN